MQLTDVRAALVLVPVFHHQLAAIDDRSLVCTVRNWFAPQCRDWADEISETKLNRRNKTTLSYSLCLCMRQRTVGAPSRTTEITMESNGDLNGSGIDEPSRPSADQMDESRYDNMAHEYLCRLREAREWIQTCLDDELPELIEFEESLRNGVVLARLAHFVSPKVVRQKDIFDMDQSHYHETGLHFRHTDNISRFLKVADTVGLPKVFYPEVVDIYDKKNMPKVIYCIHALSIYLHKRFGNKFPKLTDVSGSARFTEEEISAMAKELAKYGITIPAFGKIGGLLANEMPIDQVALHAAIIAINDTIQKGDDSATLQALRNPNAHLYGTLDNNQEHYQKNLLTAQQKKQATVDPDDSLDKSSDAQGDDLYRHFLTRNEIQECIDTINTITLVDEVNEVLASGNAMRLILLLRDPMLELGTFVDAHPQFYLSLLQAAAADKAASGNGTSTLTKEEIRDVILRGQLQVKELVSKANAVVLVNRLLESADDQPKLLAALHNLDRVEQIGPIFDSSINLYARNLANEQQVKKEKGDGNWIQVSLSDPPGDYYTNIKNGEVRTVIPEGDSIYCAYLNQKEIKDIIQVCNSEESQNKEADAAKRIQGAWRSYHSRRAHSLEEKDAKQQDEAARRIQEFYKKYKPRRDYHVLMNSPNPSLYVVQRFASLLIDTDIDYEEELEIERLRKAITDEIRQHKKLEKQLDELDLQIGLLVRNRINVDKMKQRTEEKGRGHGGASGASSKRASMVEANGDGRSPGFDLLTKPGRQRMHAYQNLLYFLTRNPKYLSKLLLARPAADADHFVQNLVLPLFNYGTGSYEEYLLLRFFKTAVEMEMDQKDMRDLKDIPSTHIVTVDQLLKYIHGSHGDQYKRVVLDGLLSDLAAVKEDMDTDPVQVYRRWLAEVESQTGSSSDLPYDVTADQAFAHTEVKDRIHKAVTALERWVTDFLETILKNLEKIPYSLRYFCKALQSELTKMFPEATGKAVCKSVGDVLFYGFLHSCLSSQERTLNNEDRSKRQKQAAVNVARLLRCTMINKGYNDEYAHLVEFNAFIKECHKKFRSFFSSVCDVPDLEDHFEIDEYVDYVATRKPIVVLQLGDLVNLHQILVENRVKIAPDEGDPLNELLGDFGVDRPSISDVVGNVDEKTQQRMEGAELVLTLTDKFGVLDDGKNAIRHELLRTKKYLVDIILCQRAASVTELLQMPVTEIEEEKHKALMESQQKNVAEIMEKLSLTEKKTATFGGLAVLEEAGLVSREKDYSEIIASIAQDIRTRRRYRVNRSKETKRLLATLQKLNRKSISYREQVNYYDMYMKACLNSMPAQAKKRLSLNRSSIDSQTKIMPPTTVKYSAADLLDKGVLVTIDDLPRNSYKNVHFEIKNTSEPGVFEVSTKFMGTTNLEVEVIILQNLLQLQYQNVQETTLFGRMKLNVSKLIALLNKKFFAKHK